MKPEEQIDQKQLLKLIKVLNDQFKAKIKTKGSITDLAEAFATGVETLSDKALPDEVIDFFNDLFNDESTGYKDVDVAKLEPVEDLPIEDVEPEPPPEEEGLEELDELEPEQELPGEEEEEAPPPEDDDELEELDELEEEEEEEAPPPPKKGRGRPATKKPEPKPTVKKPIEKKISKAIGDKSTPKEEPTMLEKLQSIANKPELKAFVKEYNINIKLKNNESLQVWKAKVKKLVEGICTPAPAEETKPEPKAAPKPAKKQSVKPKAAPKAEKKRVAKAKAEKPEKKAVAKSDKPKKSRGEKDAFGVTAGSLTHAFVQAIYKKPATMKMLIDAGIGKHPKALKKFIAMGYMERDKAGIIQMTVKGRKVYGGGK